MCGASTRTRSVSSPPCLLVFCVAHADVAMSPSQRTSARTPAVARTSAVTTTSGSTCASTRASRCPRAAASDGGKRSVCQRHFRFRYDLYVSHSSLRAPSPDFCLLSRALGRFIDEDGCPPYDGLRHGMNGHDPPVSMISCPFPLPPCTIIIPFRLASFRRLLLLLPVCLFFRALDVYAYVYVYDVARLGLCACITCCPLCIVPPTVSLSVSVSVPSCMLSSRPCMTEPSA